MGQRPLQREKLLVMIAINLSRGLSMTRVATTPAALHPKPMHIVRACFPWAPTLRNMPSRLKATRGRYPKSSSRVNRGKKIAIGGSITLTTQAVARYTPSIRRPLAHPGKRAASARPRSQGRPFSISRTLRSLDG